MIGQPNRFIVRYLANGRVESFFVHEIEEAFWWAAWMRTRWQRPTWIDSEKQPALRSES